MNMEEINFLRSLVSTPCARLIVALQAQNEMTVRELERATGMSPPAISRALSKLEAVRLVATSPAQRAGVGRPPLSYSLDRSAIADISDAVRRLQRDGGPSK